MSNTRDFARHLRQSMTDAERRLWQELRAHRFGKLKFKRQQPFGQYVLDFVCFEKKVVIELDGGQHAEAVSYDAKRDDHLRNEGFLVLRFWNNDVLNNRSGVLEAIAAACGINVETTPSPLTPLPRGERG